MSDPKDTRKDVSGESSWYGTRVAATTPLGVTAAGRWWPWRFVHNRVAPIGLVIIAANLGVALLAPVIVPHDVRAMHPVDALRPPGHGYLFGTDEFGRDVLSRVLMGSRVSLSVAFLSVLTSVLLGTTLGLTAGFYGGWWDALAMRAMDIIFAFPAILLAIAIMAGVGAQVGQFVVLPRTLLHPPIPQGPARAARAVPGVGVRG